MRNFNVLLLCILYAMNFQAQTISGKIPTQFKTAKLFYDMQFYDVDVDSTGAISWKSESPLSGFFNLNLGKLGFDLYLEPQTKLNFNVELNENNVYKREDITISGTHIEKTEFLIDWKFKSDSLNGNKKDLFSKGPEEFEALQKKRIKERLSFLEASLNDAGINDKMFIDRMKNAELVKFHYQFYYYQGDHNRSVPGNTDTVPQSFKGYLDDTIDISNAYVYKNDGQYGMYLRSYYGEKISEQLISSRESLSNLEYFKAYVAILEKGEYPEFLRNDMFSSLIIDYMNSINPETKSYLKKVIEQNVHTGVFLKRWKEFLKNDSMYANGDMAPDFTYTDIRGNKVSLSDFKGKVVYIDLWATWCGPCIKELPYLKALKQKYKLNENMVFIGISLDDDIEAWKRMVKKESDNLLTGLQLATGAYDTELNAQYNINGIPHFILIGKDGRIINKKAARPSDMDLEGMLQQSLNN